MAEFSVKVLTMINRDTTTCDACGRRYVINNYKDRCPVCCPERKDDESDNYEQVDEAYGDDE